MPLSARAPLERDSRDTSGNLRARSSKGILYMNPTRRRGRPAHQRSPDDSPLRDGNRDRLIGLLTLRAAKTLEYYFVETNLTYHHWLSVRFALMCRQPHRTAPGDLLCREIWGRAVPVAGPCCAWAVGGSVRCCM